MGSTSEAYFARFNVNGPVAAAKLGSDLSAGVRVGDAAEAQRQHHDARASFAFAAFAADRNLDLALKEGVLNSQCKYTTTST